MDKKRIIRAGALFVASILLSIWGYSYLKSENLFTTDQVFYGVYDDVNGLSAGNAVYINGYKIGQVKEVGLNENRLDEIVVEFTVKSEVKIPETAVAEIADLDIMGTKGIRLLVAKESEKYLESGDTLGTALEEGLKAQVNRQILPIKVKAEDLMSSFDSLLVAAQTVFDENTRNNLSKSFDHLKNTLSNLENTSYQFDTLMTTQRSKMAEIISNTASITENINNNKEKINKVINNFSSISDSLAKANLAATIHNADSAITQFNMALSKVNSGTGSAGQLIYNDTLYNNLEKAAENLDILVKDLQENPKRYVRFSIFDVGNDKAKKKNKK